MQKRLNEASRPPLAGARRINPDLLRGSFEHFFAL
jgi:hypothetical protein